MIFQRKSIGAYVCCPITATVVRNDLDLYPGLTHAEGVKDWACACGATSASDLSWHSPQRQLAG